MYYGEEYHRMCERKTHCCNCGRHRLNFKGCPEVILNKEVKKEMVEGNVSASETMQRVRKKHDSYENNLRKDWRYMERKRNGCYKERKEAERNGKTYADVDKY